MEVSDFKYVSENTLDLLALHDCEIQRSILIDDILYCYIDHLDVLPEHPLNDFPVAKRTGEALILFKKIDVLESYMSDSSIDTKPMCNLPIDQVANEFEILNIKTLGFKEKKFVYQFCGDIYKFDLKRSEYAEFTICFSKSVVSWNEFTDDAWFVNGPENTK